VTNCGATSELAICGPVIATKKYVLVAEKLSLIIFLVVIIVSTTIEDLGQFGRHSYRCNSDELYGH
jgi:hypothetical protein